MSLTREDVEHVAALARLGLDDDEVSRMQEQLSSILGNIDLLNELDTDAIPPTAQVGGLQNVLRGDAITPSLPQSEVMRIAPDSRDGFIAVATVLGATDEGGSA